MRFFSNVAMYGLLRNSSSTALRATRASRHIVRMCSAKAQQAHQLNVLYDSKCLLCKMEIDFLKKRNTEGKLKFTDIEEISYDPTDVSNGGISYREAMETMTAVTNDGQVIKGVPVFASAYEAVGLGYFFAFTKLPVIRDVAGAVYRFWAGLRTYMTRGGKSVDDLVTQRNMKLKDAGVTDDDCGDTCQVKSNERF